MTPLGQRDSRWGNIALGFSNTKIKDFGCVITCIAMLAGTTPDVVNRELKRVGGFANGNLVVWSKIPAAFPQLTFITRSKVYNNDVVKANLPCLVEVDFDNSPNSFGNHWVIYIGNQRLLDPWTGQERSTSSYKITKGYAIVKKKELIEPEPAEPQETPPIPETTPEPIPTPEEVPTDGTDTESVVSRDFVDTTWVPADSGDTTRGMDSSVNPFGGDTPTTQPEAYQEVPIGQLPPKSIVPLETIWRAIINLFRRLLRR